jgi:hypothetical protein
VANPQ